MPGPSRITQRHTLPDGLRALDVLPSDYVDLFVAPTTGVRPATAEEWARTAIEGAPAAGRFVAWRLLCGLRLQSGRSAGAIGGWQIEEATNRWIRLQARSWFMTANVVFYVADDELLFATFIRYDHPLGRGLWAPVSAVHRRAAPGLLARATREMKRLTTARQ